MSRVVAVALAVVAFFWQVSRYPAQPNSDDAYISFRYAENLAHGAGPVFNAGERVEGYTDPLWVAVLAGLNRVGADTPRAAYLLSVLLGAATIALVSLLPARIAPALWGPGRSGGDDALGTDRRELALAGAAAALLLGCSHALAFHSVQGLETPLMAAVVTAALLALDPRTGRPGWSSASLFVLAMLTRPEGLLLFLVVAGAFVARSAKAGGRLPYRELLPCAAAIAAYGCFLGWRLWYYGAIVPNTYFAKRAALGADLVSGTAYVGEWLASGLGAVAAVACLVVALSLGWRAVASWPILLLGTHAMAVVTTGGDHFPLGRFFVPLAPLAVAVAALAVLRIPALLHRPRGTPTTPRALLRTAQGAAMATACAVVAVPGLRQTPVARAIYTQFTGKWAHIGRVLRERLPAGTVIALSPVGAIPYFSGLPTVDILGLTDAHVAHVAADPAIARKGHQKHDGPYVLSRNPDVLILGNGLIVSRDGARPGELWWWPDAGFGPDGTAVRGRRLDWRREGSSLSYEADIESDPAFGRSYRPALVPLQDGLELLVWRRVVEARPPPPGGSR